MHASKKRRNPTGGTGVRAKMFQEAGRCRAPWGSTAMNLIWAHPVPLSTPRLNIFKSRADCTANDAASKDDELGPTEVEQSSPQTVEAFGAVTR